ncbi:hypothetical protein, partial [Oleiagrimonas sp. MCCC 1A03011]|uniref:hypothetical protein n=1 Tax=Oleiagrimonas sp. MCCC 1A03011 TaxID=1926883 RepID=UPI000DC2528F
MAHVLADARRRARKVSRALFGVRGIAQVVRTGGPKARLPALHVTLLNTPNPQSPFFFVLQGMEPGKALDARSAGARDATMAL